MPERIAHPKRFNPRPRTGSDIHADHIRVEAVVSIRAPARGATEKTLKWGLGYKFQSAPPHGERPLIKVC